MKESTGMIADGSGKGWPDFLKVGPMAGGWDDAAWAAKGLPTDGDLVITASITGVSHSKPA